MLIQLEINLGGGAHRRGVKESREGDDSAFLTPLDAWGDEIEDKFQGDMSKPRQVHYKTEWKTRSRRRLLESSDQGTRKRHGVLAKKIACHHCLHKTAPLDCIERVISQKGETTLYQRLFAPRPVPRIIIKNTWNQQQQQQQQGDLGSFQEAEAGEARR